MRIRLKEHYSLNLSTRLKDSYKVAIVWTILTINLNPIVNSSYKNERKSNIQDNININMNINITINLIVFTLPYYSFFT